MSKQVLAIYRTQLVFENIKVNFSIVVIVWNCGFLTLTLSNRSTRISSYIKHSITAWNSLSTLSLQKGQSLSFTGRRSYLPVSILSGAVPHLNLAKADLWQRGSMILQYSSVPKVVLNCLYVRSLLPPTPFLPLYYTSAISFLLNGFITPLRLVFFLINKNKIIMNKAKLTHCQLLARVSKYFLVLRRCIWDHFSLYDSRSFCGHPIPENH